MEQDKLEKIFRGYGKLMARSWEGSPPYRYSQAMGFIAPKVRAMEFSIELQSALMKAFLGGVMDIIIGELKADIEGDV